MRRVLTGAGLGLTVGVAARWWMRLVATEPELTWLGTGFVLAVFTVAGVGAGTVAAARARQGSRWWRLAGLLAVPVFLSPGMVLAPAALVGGWGLRRGPWARAVAVVALLLGPALLLAVTWDEVERSLMPLPDAVYRAVLGGGATLLGAALAWGGSVVLGPWPQGHANGPLPEGERAVGGAAVLWGDATSVGPRSAPQ